MALCVFVGFDYCWCVLLHATIATRDLSACTDLHDCPRTPVLPRRACLPVNAGRNVRYEGDKLLDEADDGVMMEWERPLMEVYARAQRRNRREQGPEGTSESACAHKDDATTGACEVVSWDRFFAGVGD